MDPTKLLADLSDSAGAIGWLLLGLSNPGDILGTGWAALKNGWKKSMRIAKEVSDTLQMALLASWLRFLIFVGVVVGLGYVGVKALANYMGLRGSKDDASQLFELFETTSLCVCLGIAVVFAVHLYYRYKNNARKSFFLWTTVGIALSFIVLGLELLFYGTQHDSILLMMISVAYIAVGTIIWGCIGAVLAFAFEIIDTVRRSVIKGVVQPALRAAPGIVKGNVEDLIPSTESAFLVRLQKGFPQSAATFWLLISPFITLCFIAPGQMSWLMPYLAIPYFSMALAGANMRFVLASEVDQKFKDFLRWQMKWTWKVQIPFMAFGIVSTWIRKGDGEWAVGLRSLYYHLCYGEYQIFRGWRWWLSLVVPLSALCAWFFSSAGSKAKEKAPTIGKLLYGLGFLAGLYGLTAMWVQLEYGDKGIWHTAEYMKDPDATIKVVEGPTPAKVKTDAHDFDITWNTVSDATCYMVDIKIDGKQVDDGHGHPARLLAKSADNHTHVGNPGIGELLGTGVKLITYRIQCSFAKGEYAGYQSEPQGLPTGPYQLKILRPKTTAPKPTASAVAAPAPSETASPTPPQKQPKPVPKTERCDVAALEAERDQLFGELNP